MLNLLRVSKLPAPIKLKPEMAKIAVLQLSVMLNSGVSITRAVEALMKSDDATLRSFGESILQSISAGYYLSQALQRATDSFTKAQISLISTGERTGRLALVLRRLSEQMEREDNFRRQLGSALIYPTGILIVTGLMALFMMNFMLPQLLEAVGTLIKNPPLPTRILAALSEHGGTTTLLCLVSLCSAPWFFSSVPQAQAIRTWLLFESPVVGRIGRNTEISNLSRQLALLLDAGLTITHALDALHSRNPKLNRAMRAVLEDLTTGSTLAQAFAATGEFPTDFVALMEVGEETGRLSRSLHRQAEYLEVQTEREMQDLVKLIEPLTMMVLGAVVGFVILGCFLPVYQVVSQTL